MSFKNVHLLYWLPTITHWRITCWLCDWQIRLSLSVSDIGSKDLVEVERIFVIIIIKDTCIATNNHTINSPRLDLRVTGIMAASLCGQSSGIAPWMTPWTVDRGQSPSTDLHLLRCRHLAKSRSPYVSIERDTTTSCVLSVMGTRVCISIDKWKTHSGRFISCNQNPCTDRCTDVKPPKYQYRRVNWLLLALYGSAFHRWNFEGRRNYWK